MYSVVNRHTPPGALYESVEDWTPPNSATPLYPATTPPLSPKRKLYNPYDDEHWMPSAPYGVKEKRKTSPLSPSKPKIGARSLFKGFERPHWGKIVMHFLACIASYPAMYLLTLVARERSLFIARVLVAVWCSVFGFCLAFSLVEFATKHLEAASELMYYWILFHTPTWFIAWATVIHLSHTDGGMRVKDLASNSEVPTNFGPAIKLLWARITHPGTARSSRQTIEWVVWLLAVTVLTGLVN